MWDTKKILITWWLWYIGSHTAVVFAQAWYEVVIIDNVSTSHMDVLGWMMEITGKQIDFYDVDIRDYDGVKKVFADHYDIGGVIHFAAKKAVGESCENPFLYYDNNILGTLNLLAIMHEYNKKNIVFSSSCTVYDIEKNIAPFSETDRLYTNNPYGTTKLVDEMILHDLARHQNYNCINLRYFNPIGAHPSLLIGENPKGPANNILPYIFKVLMWEVPYLKVFGNDYDTVDGTGIRDYIHVMDIAEAHLLAYNYILDYEQFAQEVKKKPIAWLYDVFNLWTGEWLSVKQLIKLVEEATDKRVAYKTVWRRPGDVAVAIANAQKAKKILWREAKRTLFSAVQDQWHFLQKHNIKM